MLVNNAGRGISRMVSELTDADVDDMMTINVKSVLYGIQAVLPYFREQQRGHIITISSGLSRFPLAPQRGAYSAAKAAVNLLMGSLRMELRAAYPAIHCTTVMPGVVATNFGKNALYGGVDSRALPDAQPVVEVAQVIANAIERPVAEVLHAAAAARARGALLQRRGRRRHREPAAVLRFAAAAGALSARAPPRLVRADRVRREPTRFKAPPAPSASPSAPRRDRAACP